MRFSYPIFPAKAGWWAWCRRTWWLLRLPSCEGALADAHTPLSAAPPPQHAPALPRWWGSDGSATPSSSPDRNLPVGREKFKISGEGEKVLNYTVPSGHGGTATYFKKNWVNRLVNNKLHTYFYGKNPQQEEPDGVQCTVQFNAVRAEVIIHTRTDTGGVENRPE